MATHDLKFSTAPLGHGREHAFLVARTPKKRGRGQGPTSPFKGVVTMTRRPFVRSTSERFPSHPNSATQALINTSTFQGLSGARYQVHHGTVTPPPRSGNTTDSIEKSVPVLTELIRLCHGGSHSKIRINFMSSSIIYLSAICLFFFFLFIVYFIYFFLLK